MEPEAFQLSLLVRFFNEFYRRLGRFVARHAIAVVLVCTLITVICTVKVAKTPRRSSLTGYAPEGARSREEYGIYQEFFDRKGQGIALYVLVLAKDNGTMLRNDYLNETVQILDLVSNNFTVFNAASKKNESFTEFCSGFCQINEPVRQFYVQGAKNEDIRRFEMKKCSF
uniref:SSD domain-containing protein n=1 Tax=Steinernema glaseri TaxID=37863 RepID=A0A1I7YYR5_9BILA